jgi:hypothetical protein
MMRDLLRHAVLVLSILGCGGNLSPTSGDAGDASSSADGCTKCVDGSPFPDAGADATSGGDCPPQAPATWTVMCGPGSTTVCNYAGTTDAGADADLACVCQPHGEDLMAYDCATYDECMSASGTVSASMKSCNGDNDCRAVAEQTDCCGSLLYVGVANISSELFDACEASWASQYPPCKCLGSAKTEDGNATAMNGSTASAHCVSTSSGKLCMTSTP